MNIKFYLATRLCFYMRYKNFKIISLNKWKEIDWMSFHNSNLVIVIIKKVKSDHLNCMKIITIFFAIINNLNIIFIKSCKLH